MLWILERPIVECVERAMQQISKGSCVNFKRIDGEQNDNDDEVLLLLFEATDDAR